MKKAKSKTNKTSQKLETMKIDNVLFFPCRICNRLFKEKKMAMQHLQKCRPRIYLTVTNNKIPENAKKDPYEIIPEEMDNNNSIDIGKSCWNKFQKTGKKQKESGIKTKSGKKSTRKSNKRLNEDQIQDRLRKISETLNKRREIQTGNREDQDDMEDYEEDDERRAIEDRLSSLNKDTENYCENDDEIKEEDNITRSKDMVVITQRPDGQLHGCRKCPEVFVSALELFRHSRKKHTYPRIIMAMSEIQKLMKRKDRTFCPICEKPLNSTYRSIFVKHLLTHSIDAEHECPTCKRKFRRRDHMRAHQKRHIV